MEMGETERASFPGSLAKATVRGGTCGPPLSNAANRSSTMKTEN